ncbi:MAG TPA: hypothetical protein DCY82_11395 [Acidimicrobiaceae bacterium]|jgi:hypothetical protein|nr:hypothetical protein [Acidimicrobiaceae bacterium]
MNGADMVLTLTRYFDAEPIVVEGILAGSLDRWLDVAATRIGASRTALVTEAINGGFRVHAGLHVLDGSELHVSGESRLTTLKITIPWEHSDNSKTLAANAFAEAIADEVQLAA